MSSSLHSSHRPASSMPKSHPSKPPREPAAVPLPPSPPASDALILDELPPPSPSRATRQKSRLARFDLDASIGASWPSVVPATHPKRRRPADDPFDSSSPPSSPTTRKSLDPKRLKTSSPSPLPSSSPDYRDSPNNPFLVKPGELSRRAGSRRDDEHRRLVYVFRGKRIPYDPTEDLEQAGGSPFSLSGPKLLFPSPPTPPPKPQLALDEEEPIASGSDINRLAFQTPKRDKIRLNTGPEMLPTPQSRPRKTDGKNSSRTALAGVAKSSKTMAKAMR